MKKPDSNICAPFDHQSKYSIVIAGIALALCASVTPFSAAHAAPTTCSASAANINHIATISGTSIQRINTQTTATLTCDEAVPTPMTCSSYAALNPTGGYNFTLERADGRTQSGSIENRIVAYPMFPYSLTTISQPGQFAGNAPGTNSGVTIQMRLEGPTGGVIESGLYSGVFNFQSKLVALNGFGPTDDCATDRFGDPLPLDGPTWSTAVNIDVTVPEQCEMTTPATLDFGRPEDLLSDVLSSSSIIVTCNNNDAKFHAYIDAGSNPDGDQRHMKLAGGTDLLPYELYSDAARQTPFAQAASADPENAGDYVRSMAGRTVDIFGKMPAQAGSPKAGIYTDTVNVYVEY